MNGCLTHEQLKDLLSQPEQSSSVDSVVDHFNECDECQQRASEEMPWSDLQEFRDSQRRLETARIDVTLPETIRRRLHELTQNTGRSDSSENEWTSADPLPETIGEYKILDDLGHGGMGRVYLGYLESLDRKYAIKVIRDRNLKRSTLTRFEREMKTLASLGAHANVVHVPFAGEDDGNPYFVMEYVQGTNLDDVVKENGAVPVDEAVALTIQVAKGLQHIHSAGLVHRDIKPSNLILDGNGVVRIVDFGLVHVAGGSPEETRLTRDGIVMGSVDFMAPEQARSVSDVDGRADLYSLGATLAWLLTGDTLYHGNNVTEIVLAHQQNPVPPLASFGFNAPDAVEDVYQRLVAKNVDDRFQTAEDAVMALENCFLGKKSPQTRPLPNPESGPDTAPATDQADSQAPIGTNYPKWKIAFGFFAATLFASILIFEVKIDDSGPTFKLRVRQTTVEPIEFVELKPLGVVSTRDLAPDETDKSARIPSMQFTDSGQLLVAVGQSVQAWDLTDPKSPLKTGELLITGEKHTVDAIHVLDENESFAAGCTDGRIRICTMENEDPLKILPPPGTPPPDWGIESLAVHPDNKTVMAGYWNQGNGSYVTWNRETGDMLKRVPFDDTVARTVAYSPDGSRFAVAGKSGILSIGSIDVPDAEPLTCKHDGAVNFIEFSPNGKFIASVDAQMYVHVWKVETGKLAWELQRDRKFELLKCCRFIPNSDALVIGSGAGFFLVDTETRKKTPVVATESMCETIEFSPNGDLLLTACGRITENGGNGRVEIWDLKKVLAMVPKD